MRECIRRARAGGASVLSLHTTDLMRVAKAMYERMGFVRAPELDFRPAPGVTIEGFRGELDGAEVVINMVGRSVNCRYTRRHREEILRSRVDSVRAVGEAIARAARPPAVWLQASTATIYAHRLHAAHDEATGILGGGEPGAPDTWRFSIEVATAWERALAEAATPRTRKVALRSAMIMSPTPAASSTR